MIERGFRFATTSGQDGNAVMKALTTSSNIQQDGLRQNAEVSGSSGCSECIGDSGSVPLKTEVNYNLKKRKHPAWIWLMLMQQLMTLLLSVHTTTGSKWRTAPVWMAAVLLLLPTGLALDPSKIIAPVGGDKDYRSLRERGSKLHFRSLLIPLFSPCPPTSLPLNFRLTFYLHSISSFPERNCNHPMNAPKQQQQQQQ